MTNEEVQNLWAAHVDYLDAHREEWVLNRAAFETRAWERGRPFGLAYDEVRKKLDFLLEMNKVEPFLTAIGSSLFQRRARTVLRLSGVQPATAGRPASRGDTGDAVAAVADDWLYRKDIQDVATDAYRMALLYGAAGFRMGENPKGAEALDQLWLEACPRWECLWDPLASPGLERYRGHCRMRLLREAEELVGASIDVKPVALSDVLSDGLRGHPKPGRPHGFEGYVRLIELYDFEELEQRYYVVDGMTTKPVGSALPMPWTYPTGEPGCPIVPVVLLHTPDAPLDGIPAVRRLVQINMEQNLMASIVINAARRDAARTILYKPGTFAKDAMAQIQKGLDLTMVEVAGPEVSQLDVWPLQTPPLPASIGDAIALLASGWRDVQGTSDIQQGKQGKYVSAREAGLLAAYGERSVSDLQAQMNDTIADVVRLLFVALAARKANLSVTVNGERRPVKADDLTMPWEVSIADAGATPVSDSERKEEFSAIQAVLMTLTKIAAGESSEGPPPSPEVQRMAQLQLDHLVRTHRLPDEMGWSGALERLGKSQPKPPDPAEIASAIAAQPTGAAPMMPPEEPVPGMAPGMGGPPPTIPGLPPRGQML